MFCVLYFLHICLPDEIRYNPTMQSDSTWHKMATLPIMQDWFSTWPLTLSADTCQYRSLPRVYISHLSLSRGRLKHGKQKMWHFEKKYKVLSCDNEEHKSYCNCLTGLISEIILGHLSSQGDWVTYMLPDSNSNTPPTQCSADFNNIFSKLTTHVRPSITIAFGNLVPFY